MRFIEIFGFNHGIVLAIKFRLNLLNHFKLPFLRYSFALRKGTSDKATFWQVFVKKQYNIRYPKNVNVVIDGGANIGLFTVFIKNKYPAAKVICVEPDPENFEALKTNAGKYENVFLEQAGLWNTAAMLDIHRENDYDKSNISLSESENKNL